MRFLAFPAVRSLAFCVSFLGFGVAPFLGFGVASADNCLKIHNLVLLPDGRVMPVGGSEYADIDAYLRSVKGEVEALTVSREQGRITVIERPADCEIK